MTPNSACWSTGELADVLGCDAQGNWGANGVSIDTRTLQRDDLFVAIGGPNHDGHDYVNRALEMGAAAAVVSRVPNDCADTSRLLVVDDTFTALQKIGTASRDRMNGKVVAITGSVGKTSTKEMMRQAFDDQGLVSASPGNLNNHYGVPLSLARMQKETDFGLFEVGMNHAGEILLLVKMIRPHVSVITAIEAVHTEFFNSVDEIAKAKAEIFQGLEPGGVAIINRDSPYFGQMADAAKDAGAAKIIGFGEDAQSDAKLLSLTMSETSSNITALIEGDTIEYELSVPGSHHALNSLAVLAAVSVAGGCLEKAAKSLKNFRPLKGRGVRSIIRLPNGGEAVLIDESYNASPASMEATLKVVGLMTPAKNGRRIAVLGDMLELGTASPDMHRELCGPLTHNSFDLVFASGQHMLDLWNELPQSMRGGFSVSPEELSRVVTSELRDGDVVVVKGSLGSRVGFIVKSMLELGED